MKQLIGQDHILELIKSKKRDTFPRSLTLLGPWGSGKHLILQYVEQQLNLQSVDITEKLNNEFISELYLKPEPHIYVIEVKKLTVREQNIILKFLEEPLKNAYIILLAEVKTQMLPTVFNRCVTWTLHPYSKSVLKQFTDDNTILEIADTPGVVETLKSEKLSDIIELCNKIIFKINTASIPNILTISDKFAYKNEKDKFNIDVFSKVLQHVILKTIRENSDVKFLNQYRVINKWVNEHLVANVNQRYLFDRFVLELHRVSQGA